MPAPPRHPTPPSTTYIPMTARTRRSWGYQFLHMGHQSPGKSSRGTDLLSPLRLYQQHNERTGAGATQSKTPKRDILFWSGLVPKKQKKQKHRTRYHLQHKRRNFRKTNHENWKPIVLGDKIRRCRCQDLPRGTPPRPRFKIFYF